MRSPSAELLLMPTTLGTTSASIYREHAQRVAGWASRLGGPARRSELEDVVQDVFLRVHRSLPGFRGDAEITTWLYRITENVVRARRRKEQVKRFLGFQQAPERDAEELPSPRPTPEAEVEKRERARILYEALDRVPERYRNAFILFEIEGLSGEEVATLTGVKVATLWVQLSRAREMVMAQVERRHVRAE